MMTQEIAFYIEGSASQRPTSSCTIYVDGAAGKHYRKGLDIELSHWLPNQTEDRFKAGTSTEICFNFLTSKDHVPYDLVINNHLDIDGILSVFALTHPRIALTHQRILCEAALAGDFWAWAEGKSLKLFQELTLFYRELATLNVDKQASFQQCFGLILNILKNPDHETDARKILEQQYALIEQGKIIREELNDRVVCYYVPQKTLKGKQEQFSGVARFNEPISERLAFWPQVRNRYDQEKIQLVAFEEEEGTNYDLWLPGYCWADTRELWRVPSMLFPINTEDYHRLEWDALSQIVVELNDKETGPCHWQLFPGLDFANRKNLRDFPIIMSTLNSKAQREGSQLSAQFVKNIFRRLVTK